MNAAGPRIAHVSEVLDRLLQEFGNDPAQRPVLFQAALRVCAEESRRATPGRPSAPLDVLVERARAQLGTPQGKANLDAARGSKATPVYVPPTDNTVALPADKAPAPLPDKPVIRSSQPAAVPPDRLTAPPPERLAAPLPDRLAAPPPDKRAEAAPRLSADEPVELSYPAAPRLSDLSTFGPEAPAIAESAEVDRLPEETDRRPRPSLVLGLIGLVALVAMAYIGLRWFGVLGTSSSPRSVQSAAPSPVPVPPARAAATPPAPAAATTAAQKRASAPATPPTGTPTPANAAVQGSPAPIATRAQPPTAGYAETMVSPTWSGRPSIYVVHFSSFRERANADRDAARIAKEYGRPAYSAEVTIPERGIYYRVILGDFATAAEARAFRAELIAADTPGVGAVYWVVGP